MNISTSIKKRLRFPRQFYILITIVITSYSLISCSLSAEGETPARSVDRTTIGPAIDEAERFFAGRTDLENLKKAVEVLGNARDPNERSYDVEWKFAKYSHFLGKRTENEDEAIKIFEAGKSAGQIASRVMPNATDGHFWYAANLGELSRISPVTVGIRSVEDIRHAMKKVIEIDPTYQGASAYDALGQLEMETRNIKGGTAEKALEYLEKGFALNKNNSNLRLHLAEAYFANKRDLEGRNQLTELIKMEPDPEYILEHQLNVTKAKRLLERNR